VGCGIASWPGAYVFRRIPNGVSGASQSLVWWDAPLRVASLRVDRPEGPSTYLDAADFGVASSSRVIL
jgi:hypothetical protein